jgi:hypothetical protein
MPATTSETGDVESGTALKTPDPALSTAGGERIAQTPTHVQQHSRTRPLTEAECAAAVACMACGMTLRGAARAIGRTHPTLIRRMRRDRQFAQQMRQAKRRARLDPLEQIRRSSRKSWRAAAWLLKYLDNRERGAKLARGERQLPESAS